MLVAGALWGTAAPASAASSSTWCGTPGTVDRLPQGNPGAPVHEIYAIPADGTDRLSTEIGTLMQTDYELIDGWWRGQDPTRTPRFDTLGFGCGQQLDISSVKLTSTAAELQPINGRFGRILSGLVAAGFNSAVTKYVVYYDGPNDGTNICGQGAGSAEDEGVAIVFVNACAGVPSSVVAAHELLHALGALPSPGPPHPCSGDPGHPCDSPLDILYPYSDATPLSGRTLDVGHDDYYAHSGSWFDIQDSRWLRHLDTAPTHLSVVIQGVGTVTSDVPGISCTASCESDWDANQPVSLSADGGPGMRFVRWTGGGCTGETDCTVSLASATTVTALFAPTTYPLTISVTGKGGVRTSFSAVACTTRCRIAAVSYEAVSLHAAPVAGWRFSRWTGACRGTRTTCTLPMTSASAAGAVFVKRKK